MAEDSTSQHTGVKDEILAFCAIVNLYQTRFDALVHVCLQNRKFNLETLDGDNPPWRSHLRSVDRKCPMKLASSSGFDGYQLLRKLVERNEATPVPFRQFD